MSNWSKEQLRKIAETDGLHISPFREDGKAYGTPTWIWSVAVDDALCVQRSNPGRMQKGPFLNRLGFSTAHLSRGRKTRAVLAEVAATEPV